MPVLGLIYPCRWLARTFDPLVLGRQSSSSTLLHPSEIISLVATVIRSELSPDLEAASRRPGPVDESWYWAAPLLLDQKHHRTETHRWFGQPNLAEDWAGGQAAQEVAQGWGTHVQQARSYLDGRIELGPPPADLCEVTAMLAIAGPGVASLRALNRIAAGAKDQEASIRTSAAALAHSFLHLFNLPEVMALLRDRKRDMPYWQSVLSYCVAGNLQAVLDEYAHVLVESLGVVGQAPPQIASEVSKEMQRCLALRTATAQADLLSVSSRRVRLDDPLRLRTRFAMRFGDQVAEDSNEPTRADQVRSAFNSPFWPFVLATTSVGQEGLDFHPYCHAVVHWNLPSNPVDLEQREGRVHRYKGHALRRNIAAAHGNVELNGDFDVWAAMFNAARDSRRPDQNDLFPFWISTDGTARIERHIPILPHSRDVPRRELLRRSLVVYRMVFGQNRQEDLVRFLLEQIPQDRVAEIIDQCRLSLAPNSTSG